MRVAAQLLQRVHPHDGLPAFDSWHSAAVPYPLLVATQIAILILFAWIARGARRGTLRRRPRLGAWLRTLGLLYLAAMLARLTLGASLLSGHYWFDKPLPTLFHLVLAGYLLVLAGYHLDDAVISGHERPA